MSKRPTKKEHKLVPASKATEWQGLDRISTTVHAIGCIWRPQEKDDIGIDGEVELCIPRDDGAGRIGTGKIIKVQSKSGMSYVLNDSANTFECSVRYDDLMYWKNCNVPVIFIVYHPVDDQLYWKDIKRALVEQPNIMETPYRIGFSKSADLFDASAYAALCAICEQAPERISRDIQERLYANMLSVVKLPGGVYVSSVLPEKRAQFRERLTGFIPPHVYSSGQVISLTDPMSSDNALKRVVDDDIEVHLLEDWLDTSPEASQQLAWMLNSLLHKHLIRLGLKYNRKLKRHYFQGGSQETPLTKNWTSARTGRNNTRIVCKYYDYGKNKFYRHVAAHFQFINFGAAWALSIEPKQFFTLDGTTQWEGNDAKSYAIRWKAKEYNPQYLNHILFWAFVLSEGREIFPLNLDGAPIVELNSHPESVNVDFGIRPDGAL